jgi:hypothetical protein
MMKSVRKRWAGHVARTGDRRDTCRLSVGKPEGWKPLGISWHKLKDNIEMNFKGLGWGSVDWLDLVQDMDM